MKTPAILTVALALVGGLPGLVTTAVNAATKGKADFTPEGLETAADRACTLSDADNAAICKRLGIKDPKDVAESLRRFRVAGDALGDAVSFLEEKSTGLEPTGKTVLSTSTG